MAEMIPEKSGAADDPGADRTASAPHSSSWMHRPLRLGPLNLPPYASPPFQLLLVALVCFLCPGMFNALNGIGGGGQVDATVANHANTALYSTFSVVGFFAGSVVNRVGIRWTLSFGGFGYVLYVISFLVRSCSSSSFQER